MPKGKQRPVHTDYSLIELGSTRTGYTHGYAHEEFLSALAGARAIQIYKEMSYNDPVVGGILHAANQSIRKVHWHVDGPEGTGEQGGRGEIAREFIASCLNDMSATFPDLISEILSMLVYGWAFFEKVYKLRRGNNSNPKYRSLYSDGRGGLEKIGYSFQDTLDHWDIDAEGGIQALYQRMEMPFLPRVPGRPGVSTPFGVRRIPMSKAILYRTLVSRNNPEGRSILRTAYRSWFFKKHIEEIMTVGIERDMVGLPVLNPPEGFDLADEKNIELRKNVVDVLSRIRRDEQEGFLVPPGWTFSLVSSPGQKQFDTEKILNYYDKRIALSVLGQFILLGLERVGSFALAKVQGDLFSTSLHGWISSIAETTNRFGIHDLLRINGWEDLIPSIGLSPGRIREPDLNELSQYIVRLTQAGAISPDKELEELLRSIGGLVKIPDRSTIVQEAKKLGIPRLVIPKDTYMTLSEEGELQEDTSAIPSTRECAY